MPGVAEMLLTGKANANNKGYADPVPSLERGRCNDYPARE